MSVVVEGVLLSATLAAARYLGFCLHVIPDMGNPNSVVYFAPDVLADDRREMTVALHFDLNE